MEHFKTSNQDLKEKPCGNKQEIPFKNEEAETLNKFNMLTEIKKLNKLNEGMTYNINLRYFKL